MSGIHPDTVTLLISGKLTYLPHTYQRAGRVRNANTVFCAILPLYAVHFTLYAVHFVLYVVYFPLYAVLSTLYVVLFTLYGVLFVLYAVLCTLYVVLLSSYAVLLKLYAVHFALYAVLLSIYEVVFSLYAVLYLSSLYEVPFVVICGALFIMRMRSRIYGDLGKSLLILLIRHFVSSVRIDLLAHGFN